MVTERVVSKIKTAIQERDTATAQKYLSALQKNLRIQATFITQQVLENLDLLAADNVVHAWKMAQVMESIGEGTCLV